jgi:hypothetical protein
MPVQITSKKSFCVSLPKGDLTSSYGHMFVCRRPDCDRAATGHLGFCAADHAAYVRSRQAYASLVEAAQVAHADAFAVVPLAQRQILAEYLVAVASEGLPSLPAGTPRAAGLLAAALIARGRPESRPLGARLPLRRGSTHSDRVTVPRRLR